MITPTPTLQQIVKFFDLVSSGHLTPDNYQIFLSHSTFREAEDYRRLLEKLNPSRKQLIKLVDQIVARKFKADDYYILLSLGGFSQLQDYEKLLDDPSEYLLWSFFQNDFRMGVRYPFGVDYQKPLDELTEEGRFIKCDGRIEPKYFKNTRSGKAEYDGRLSHIGRMITTKKVEELQNEVGLRPMEIAELITFGASYLHKLPEDRIIGTGSMYIDQSVNRWFPYIYRRGTALYIDLCKDNAPRGLWGEAMKFAAIATSAY